MRRGRRGERGIALLLVLWVFMILGVLALDFARYMRDDAMAVVNLSEETRGYYIALAGMNRAIYDQERKRDENPATGAAAAVGGAAPKTLDTDADDDAVLVPPDGEWHEGDFAGGRWSVRMVDEGGRIALNKVGAEVLSRIVTNLLQAHVALGTKLGAHGLDRRAAAEVDTVVDSILDWRDHDSLSREHGAESDFYMKQRQPYRAKNSFFDSPEELLLVRGVTAELFYGEEGVPGLRDVISVYGTSAKLNVATVTAPVLQALLGIEPDAAEDLVTQRSSGVPLLDQLKGQLTSAALPTVANMLVDEPTPQVVRIDARGDMKAERNRSRVQVVAEIGGENNEGTRILRWLDRAPWDGVPPSMPSDAGTAGDA